MQKDVESSLLPIDLEIEKTCKQNRKEKKQYIEELIMAKEEKPLLDYVLPTTHGYRSTIVNPSIDVNRGFEIKTRITQQDLV